MQAERPHKIVGFTLIELIVVIAIIALLVGLLMPALGKARSTARRIQCMTKMVSIGYAMTMYTSEHDEYFPPSVHSFSTADPVAAWDVQLAPYMGFTQLAENPLSFNIFNSPQLIQLRSSFYRCPEDERDTPEPTYAPLDSHLSYGKSVYFELRPSDFTDQDAAILNIRSWKRTLDIPQPSATASFGEIAGGEFGVDHVMAHFWRLGQTIPGDGLDLVRHGNNSNYTYVDGHAGSAAFSETYDELNKIDRWNPATAQ